MNLLDQLIALAIKYPEIVTPAQAGISSRAGEVCKKNPASAGMTAVCIFHRQMSIWIPSLFNET